MYALLVSKTLAERDRVPPTPTPHSLSLSLSLSLSRLGEGGRGCFRVCLYAVSFFLLLSVSRTRRTFLLDQIGMAVWRRGSVWRLASC